MPLTRSTTFLASYIHKNDRELANRDANQIALGAACMRSRRADFFAAYSPVRRVSNTYVDSGSRAASSAINVGISEYFAKRVGNRTHTLSTWFHAIHPPTFKEYEHERYQHT